MRSAWTRYPGRSNARRHASTCRPLVSTSVPSRSKMIASSAIAARTLRQATCFGERRVVDRNPRGRLMRPRCRRRLYDVPMSRLGCQMGMAYGLIESLEARRHLSVGQPDPTFGDDGAVRIPVAPGSSVGAMDTLVDGRFVVAHTTPDASDGTILHVSRYLPDGDRDATFGGTDGEP